MVLADGRIVFVEEFGGRLSVFEDGRVRTLPDLGGSPNGLAVAPDGAILVAQNGGVVGDWRSERPRTPSIVRSRSRSPKSLSIRWHVPGMAPVWAQAVTVAEKSQ